MTAERLQKILAAAGIASRRAAERLIAEGRVAVNGAVVTALGVSADPATDRIEVDGVLIAAPSRHTYLVLNKPPRVVTTAADERGRPTVIDLLPPGTSRLFPVGRLDRDSEGLLLLTDDGDLALRLTHPRYGFEKEYLALAERPLTADAVERLRAGVEFEGRRTASARVEKAVPGLPYPPAPGRQWYRVVLHEGRKRQVRRMFAAEGVRLLRLVRVRVGPVALGDLAAGATRPLTWAELDALGVGLPG